MFNFPILPQNQYQIIITNYYLNTRKLHFYLILEWNIHWHIYIASFVQNVLLQNELPELPTLQRDGVRNVMIFLRTPPFPKMSSLLFINSYSRWSLINTLENVVLLSQVPPSLAGPCCSTIKSLYMGTPHTKELQCSYIVVSNVGNTANDVAPWLVGYMGDCGPKRLYESRCHSSWSRPRSHC